MTYKSEIQRKDLRSHDSRTATKKRAPCQLSRALKLDSTLVPANNVKTGKRGSEITQRAGWGWGGGGSGIPSSFNNANENVGPNTDTRLALIEGRVTALEEKS